MKTKKEQKRMFTEVLFSFRNMWEQFRALQEKTDAESGATFMEVLVTIAIIAILMTTIAIAVGPYIFTAQDSAARANIKTFQTALETYYVQNFDYPEEGEWKEAIKIYIGKPVPLDPWKQEYIYTKPGPDELPYGISSNGKDKAPGTEDDINSWTEDKKDENK